MPGRIGSIGYRLDIELRQGATLALRIVSAVDEAGTPVNYSGCTFEYSMWPMTHSGAGAAIALTTTQTNGGAGYDVTLPGGSAGLTAVDFFRTVPTYAYRGTLTDTAGGVHPEFYGQIRLAKDTPA